MTLVDGLEILASDLGHPEGPDFREDGGVLFVEADSGRVCVWYPGRCVTTLAATGGAPYGSTRGSDGWVYVTQSGNADPNFDVPRQMSPGIQRISPDGAIVETVCTHANGTPFIAPNDLCWGKDQRLWFTDSCHWQPDAPTQRSGLFVVGNDGTAEQVLDLGPVFANGIACEADGSIIWLESYTRVIGRLRPNGKRETVTILPEGQTPEGVCLDAEGNLWITTFEAGLVAVVAADGRLVREIHTGGVPVNCAFIGSWLYITDFGHPSDPADENSLRSGRLLRFPITVTGMALPRGALNPKGKV